MTVADLESLNTMNHAPEQISLYSCQNNMLRLRGANLNSPRHFLALYLGLDPLIVDEWSCCMDHDATEEVCEYLWNTTFRISFLSLEKHHHWIEVVEAPGRIISF